jgi:hypothetical protein
VRTSVFCAPLQSLLQYAPLIGSTEGCQIRMTPESQSCISIQKSKLGQYIGTISRPARSLRHLFRDISQRFDIWILVETYAGCRVKQLGFSIATLQHDRSHSCSADTRCIGAQLRLLCTLPLQSLLQYAPFIGSTEGCQILLTPESQHCSSFQKSKPGQSIGKISRLTPSLRHLSETSRNPTTSGSFSRHSPCAGLNS